MNTNWDDLRYFLEAAQSRSLTAAASKLGTSVATLGRRIDALEQQLGLKLLHRGPNGVVLSEHGQSILNSARAGSEHFYQLERIATAIKTGRRDSPIRISSTESVLSEVLAPALPALLATDNQIQVDLVVSNENVDLTKREADLALRLGQPKTPGLIARRVGTIRLGMYASEQYLNNRSPEDIDLRQERILGYDSSFGDIPEVVWIKDQGLSQNLAAVSSSSYSLLNSTRAGAGITMLPDFMAQRRGLVKITAAPIPTRKPWLVYHRDMKNMRDIKLVKQWMIDACQQAFT
ncbi:MAG: LysR family transcriptional regulator [Pseudomonadota bacterium]